jgi:hypothetical protein
MTIGDSTPFPTDVAARLIGAVVAGASVKLAAVGITLSPAAQLSVALAVYGVAHRFGAWTLKRFGH